ncbi:MAG: aldo/keto reductase [Elusimicrobia bacterium CG11_big_fil_rev_8_21_14_0_20_64_6]|nr:MAG: aldo/keto reductase [Elusimicrobia bacterium CG11_big_fil_rev_8_21_14_0_20_64_6]
MSRVHKNKLGRSGLQVSALSLGTMNFGADWHKVGAIDDRTASSLIDLALERGVNLIDTADIYGRGAAEEMLGRLLKGRRKKVLLATKLLGQMELGDDSTGGLSARWVALALEGSLKRLKTDHVDLYMPHGWDRGTPIEETLEALDRAMTAGKVRVLGCSNFSGDQLTQALGVSVASRRARFQFDQVQYSLASRFPESDLVPVAAREGVGLLAWSPLAGGLLSGKYAATGASGRRLDADAFPYVEPQRGAAMVKVLQHVAALEGRTCAQTALGWIMGKPFVSSAVLGARTVEQLTELLDAKPLSARAGLLLDRASEICSRP